MNPEHYQNFKSLIDRGLRTEAASELKLFVESFGDLQERRIWTRWFLEHEQLGHTIRHELYEAVVFPALFAGYEERDPWSILWLARTCQNLYRARELWRQIGFKTDYEFLKELVQLEPTNDDAKAALLERQIQWFRYTEHEWPAGILYGNDGASSTECDAILSEVNFARQLDEGNRYSAYLDSFVSRVREYKERIRTRK